MDQYPVFFNTGVLASQIGSAKLAPSYVNYVPRSVLGGLFIGLGSLLALSVSAGLPMEVGLFSRFVFGALFPVGLFLIVMGDAVLFTGEVLYFGALYWTERDRFKPIVKILSLSYLGNFIGAIILVALAYFSKVLLVGNSDGSFPISVALVKLANLKTSLPFWVLFLRGALCNWLVCLAIFLSLKYTSPLSKALMIWPPIAAFVILGFEHSIANMFFIPMGILIGGAESYLTSFGAIPLTATWWSFVVNNLVPVTLGNILGGFVFVVIPYLWGFNKFTAPGIKLD
jgi:formate/nitrite transporter